MIGVTGATGHLGQSVIAMLPDSEPIGREIPDRRFDAIIHIAAPNYRDNDAVLDFRDYNRALEAHIEKHRPDTIVVVGSWWQHGIGTCRDLLYTHLKNEQARTWPQAVHVLPYSIYGDDPRPGRGFIPQLILAARGDLILAGLSDQPRDFIHVSDVALALIRALDAPRGIYTAGTRTTITPRDLAGIFGLTGRRLDEYPSAEPRYLAPQVPGWEPTIELIPYITVRV